MEADTVMNFILRFYHLEHVANRRHPALRGAARESSALSVHSSPAAGALVHAVHIIHPSMAINSSEVPRSDWKSKYRPCFAFLYHHYYYYFVFF